MSVSRTASGRYRIRYYEPGQRNARSRTFDSEAEAREFEAQVAVAKQGAHRAGVAFDLARLDSGSYVYFVQAGEGGPIKIGVTRDIGGRLRTLQTGNPYRLRLLALIHGEKTLSAYRTIDLPTYGCRGSGSRTTPTCMPRSRTASPAWSPRPALRGVRRSSAGESN